MAHQHETGSKAELIIREYLESRDYRIRETNWRTGHKEVDIVAEQNGKIVIVEVKSRTAGRVESPTDLLNYRKMRFLVHAAEMYVLKNELDMEVRFDLAVVIFQSTGYRIDYIESAFFPGVNW
jgi:putative endonuclease